MHAEKKARAHVLVRDPRTGRLTKCWLAQPKGKLYCGTCLSGTLPPKMGAACPVCGSRVERIFEVVSGGQPGTPGRREIRRAQPDLGRSNKLRLLPFPGPRSELA